MSVLVTSGARASSSSASGALTYSGSNRDLLRQQGRQQPRQRSRLGEGMLASLPWLLMLSFLIFPMVSSAASDLSAFVPSLAASAIWPIFFCRFPFGDGSAAAGRFLPPNPGA